MRAIVSMMMLALLGVPAAALADCPQDVGAALAATCPCGADANSQAWKNHGQYVKCVVQFRNDMRHQNCADKATLRTIARCAARSTCGKEDAILCCKYDLSNTCVPGSCTNVPPGPACCSNDTTAACTTDADCITASGPKVKRHPENCTDHGGYDVGTGSACSQCPIPPPATPTPVATP